MLAKYSGGLHRLYRCKLQKPVPVGTGQVEHLLVVGGSTYLLHDIPAINHPGYVG